MQFLWDYFSNIWAWENADCYRYYEAFSTTGIMIMVTLKFICQLASPWGNFYFFYWKHKVFFKTALTAKLSTDIFYDARSDLNEIED